MALYHQTGLGVGHSELSRERSLQSAHERATPSSWPKYFLRIVDCVSKATASYNLCCLEFLMRPHTCQGIGTKRGMRCW